MKITPFFRQVSSLFLGLVPYMMALSAAPVAFASQYKTIENVLYRTDPGATDSVKEACRLDLYYPENAKGYATVIWIHGGGLTGGNRSILEKLKGQGFAVATIDYRLSPGVHSPAYIEDAAAAVAWIFKNIERYGGSTKYIFVSGHSAGAYLALMVGLDKKYLAACDVDANRLAGLISLSAQAITHFTIRKERGISDKQPVIDELAPLFYVRGDAPPILLITGDRDLEVLGRYEENAYLWRMMKINGNKAVDLQELKTFDHGGMVDPGLDLAIKFVKEHSQIQ